MADFCLTREPRPAGVSRREAQRPDSVLCRLAGGYYPIPSGFAEKIQAKALDLDELARYTGTAVLKLTQRTDY